MTAHRINVDPEAMPTFALPAGGLHFYWPAGPDHIDQLIKFIYGNQGTLFSEDAVLFETQGTYFVHRDLIRVHGSWEAQMPHLAAMPVTDYSLPDDVVAYLVDLLGEDERRMDDQQALTHDYSIDDLRQARLRNARIRRALHLKEG